MCVMIEIAPMYSKKSNVYECSACGDVNFREDIDIGDKCPYCGTVIDDLKEWEEYDG